MITKTYDETLATLCEVVAEAGEDFVYQDHYGEACYYSVKGEPACIVGRVLAKWGVDLTPMDSEYTGAGAMIGLYAGALLDHLRLMDVLEVDDPSVSLLWEAQTGQDNGETWGDALRGALAYLLRARHRV